MLVSSEGPRRVLGLLGAFVAIACGGAPSAAPETPAPERAEAEERAEAQAPAETEAPAAPPGGELAPGTRLFGNYEILERVDGAGPVVVYRARQWRGTQVRPIVVRTSTDLEGAALDSERLLGRDDVPLRALEVAVDRELGLAYQTFVEPRDRHIPLEWLLQPELVPAAAAEPAAP